jgi:hypothetical protein
MAPPESQPGSSVSPEASEVESQPSRTQLAITGTPEKSWWDKFKPFVEMAGIALLAIYTAYTIGIYYAAKDSADAARDALVRGQRPWLGADGSPSFEQSGQDFRVKVRNFGTTPALKVGVMMKRGKLERFEKEVESTCEQAREKTQIGTYLYPGNSVERRFVEVGGTLSTESNFTLIGCNRLFRTVRRLPSDTIFLY